MTLDDAILLEASGRTDIELFVAIRKRAANGHCIRVVPPDTYVWDTRYDPDRGEVYACRLALECPWGCAEMDSAELAATIASARATAKLERNSSARNGDDWRYEAIWTLGCDHVFRTLAEAQEEVRRGLEARVRYLKGRITRMNSAAFVERVTALEPWHIEPEWEPDGNYGP